ncbi:tetratricopeptide repeat protein [Oceanibium sediminis]|uniref:tetratricopeptide repeat protein n=1 Tax=Oceanibium sediminis TaxID=2026339 RepID=UPI000DD35395|nr:tetratricopeptide repeat protein [Oceanibium sediminis]
MLEFGQDTAAAADDLIKDSSEATFMADVVDASMEVPVIVDFWAPWCGPCKQLTPTLEAAVKDAKGKVKLVKVNVDENQMIAGQMRVQSIPAVFGFVGGRPVDGFMGAQTAGQVKAFIDKLIAQSPGGADDGLEEALDMADQMLEEGAVTDAAQTFAAILGEDAGNARALAGLARAHIALGDMDQARAVLDSAPEDKRADPVIAAVYAQLDLAASAEGAGELAEAEAKAAAAPDDLQAQFDLALAQISASQQEAAVDTLLGIFAKDREWNDGAAKDQLFKLFEALGPKDPIAQKGRRRLSSMIFA